jgi:hypothetical protein
VVTSSRTGTERGGLGAQARHLLSQTSGQGKYPPGTAFTVRADRAFPASRGLSPPPPPHRFSVAGLRARAGVSVAQRVLGGLGSGSTTPATTSVTSRRCSGRSPAGHRSPSPPRSPTSSASGVCPACYHKDGPACG